MFTIIIVIIFSLVYIGPFIHLKQRQHQIYTSTCTNLSGYVRHLSTTCTLTICRRNHYQTVIINTWIIFLPSKTVLLESTFHVCFPLPFLLPLRNKTWQMHMKKHSLNWSPLKLEWLGFLVNIEVLKIDKGKV